MVPPRPDLPHAPLSSLDPLSAAFFYSSSVSQPSSSCADACDASATGHSRASSSPPARPFSPVRVWTFLNQHRPSPTPTTTTPSGREYRVGPAVAAAARRRPTHMHMRIRTTRRHHPCAPPHQCHHHVSSAPTRPSQVPSSRKASGRPHPHSPTRSRRHPTPSILVASLMKSWGPPRGQRLTTIGRARRRRARSCLRLTMSPISMPCLRLRSRTRIRSLPKARWSGRRHRRGPRSG
jgi:hypothetical protein